MKPIYTTNTSKRIRPRKTIRPLGVMSRQLKADVQKYGISKIALGFTILSLGVDVVNLNLR